MLRARDWLRARGIAYVFTIAPDKHAIYPEEMPADARAPRRRLAHRPAVHRRCRTPGSRSTAAGAVEAKARERIYQQTDTHWNDRGALVAYQQIIDAVRARVPSTPAAWTRDDFEPVDRVVEGLDLAAMMGLKRVLREVDMALVPTRPRRARRRRAGGRRSRPPKKDGWSPRSTIRRCRAR